jgi:hypothetical protein
MLLRSLRQKQTQALSLFRATQALQNRYCATLAVPDKEGGIEEKEDEATRNHRLGIDTEFSNNKHSYVLSFPWNFKEIIDSYEGKFTPINSGIWNTVITNKGFFEDFNHMYREFHQFCAIPDEVGLSKICEPRLAEYLMNSV